MKHSDQTNRSTLAFGCALLALGGAACSGGGGTKQQSTNPPGQIVDKPGGGFFIAEENNHGFGQEPRIVRQMYGRLVEVFGLDSTGLRVPMASNFVMAASIVSDFQDYLVDTNPVTAQQILVILRDVTDVAPGGGRQQFFDKLLAAEQNLNPIFENDANGAGTYSMVPRNSAVVVQFDDLIDGQTLTDITFRIRTGSPPVVPFEGRALMDPNHGDLAEHDGIDGVEFYSTRIIFDPTVTEIESFESDPPLPINGVGLPPSADVNLANFEIRIPTVLSQDVGQNKLLRNPSGHPITSKNNGPVDFGSPTIDVVRAARSGGPADTTADPFNGFLPDQDPPRVVGASLTTIAEQPVSLDGGAEFLLPLVIFASEFCAQTPQPGDVFTQPGIFAEVFQEPTPVQGDRVVNVPVRLLLYPKAWDEPGADGPLEWLDSATGSAEFLSAFDEVDDDGRQACFVRILPTPTGFPENPSVGLLTSSQMSIRFSEPMDPLSLTAFDSMTLTRLPVPENEEDPPLNTSDYVVGSVLQSLNLQEFSFLPDLPLAHQLGQTETYYLTLTIGFLGPTDLAGNGLKVQLPGIALSLESAQSPQFNGGRVSRFTALDEEPPIGDETGPLPEWSGQHLYDLKAQKIRPRPVVHYQSTADRSKPVPQLMTPFSLGVQTPLSSLGSKLQTIWRYVDFGFSLTAATNHNIDVEGLYWSPAQGAVISDSYEEFEISMAHCKYAPDEYIDPGSLFPKWPKSGLKIKWNDNFLSLAKDAPKVVHPRFRGYQVNPGDLIVSQASGTKLMPFPWNRDASPEEWTTWTWRNTKVRKRGGPDTSGVDPVQLFIALGLPIPCAPPAQFYYKKGGIGTIGLPMLMEFRCYPDEGAIGANAFDISLAANSSSKPYFRAFSTGGIDQSNNRVVRDPDLETIANGGFNPVSTPPGAKTFGADNSFYIGAADFVVRVSRSHSIWFPATDPLSGGTFDSPVYNDPIIEPRLEDLQPGTSIDLHFRGMSAFSPPADNCPPGNPNMEALENALALDSYGDHYDDKCLSAIGRCVPDHSPPMANRGITFDVKLWKQPIERINGSRYYQVRVSFESDIFTGLTPELSALAVSWQE